MKLPEKLRLSKLGFRTHLGLERFDVNLAIVDLAGKVNEYHDYLAEREEAGSTLTSERVHLKATPTPGGSSSIITPTPLFKAKDVFLWVDGNGEYNLAFSTKAQAEQAREALLKLTDTH